MATLATLDAVVFRFINFTLSNPVFDWLMPFFSSNAFFFPCLLVVAAVMIWKGGVRGRLCLVLLLLSVVLGDNWICTTIKKAVARPRPFVALSEAHIRPPPDSASDEDNANSNPYKARENMNQLVLRGSYRSMPSGHSANWFAAAMVAFIYYRRSVRFMLPLAAIVAFSRVYNGVHYPSDVAAGAILGAGYAAAGIWMLDWAWQWVGKFWFPIWWKRLPSLINPEPVCPVSTEFAPPAAIDDHWLRLGYLLILALFCTRIGYIASDLIELSQNEAHYWLSSKHPALAGVSNPPLMAWMQWAGTKLFGNTQLGVRFFSPLLAAVFNFFLLRFITREANARLGFLMILVLLTTPLMAIHSTLFTTDSLAVFFWTMAIIAGWRAVREQSTMRDWLWVGLWMGLGLLSQYSALGLLICWPVFFALWRPARIQLRRPGFYVALLLSLLFLLPSLMWNAQHEWAVADRLASTNGMGHPGHALLQLGEFVEMGSVLWNPVFFIAAVWAVMAFWRCDKENPKLVYFFSLGTPVVVVHLVWGWFTGVPANWIAPALPPLFCLMIIFWGNRVRSQIRWIKPGLTVGLVGGLFAVVMLHETRLIHKLTNITVPGDRDPLRHVRGWQESAQVVNEARLELGKSGPPVFIIANNYGLASELSFYVAEAKKSLPADPLVYCEPQAKPGNDFYFWKGYDGRKGQNAIYVVEADEVTPPPSAIHDQFESVTFFGSREIKHRGQVFHRLQLFFCRNLR